MKFTEKETDLIKSISLIAAIFTIVIALAMIFSFIQLKTINPLDNPALLSIREQYDRNPEAANIADQVRAMDLMARKAYFASRRQVETGSYLLLAGALIFILCQRLLAGNQKEVPAVPGNRPGRIKVEAKGRQYILATAAVIFSGAVLSSFLLRSGLPDLSGAATPKATKTRERAARSAFRPDKTNYPFFRGQDGRGIAGGSDYPVEWDGVEGKNIKWKAAIPKNGKSSPVIWGKKLFLTGADYSTGEVYCVDKETGQMLWVFPVTGIPGEPAEPPETDQDAGLAVSSAAVNEQAVCAIFSNGNLVCLDHDGKVLWAKNIGVPENVYGYASSLLIYGNILVVQFDANEKLSLMGFELESGNLKWETLRRGRAAWSSPVIASFNGLPQVVINGNPEVTSFDAVSGEELWTIEGVSGDVAPSLAVNSTMVYCVADYSRLAAIKASGPSVAWQDNMFTPDVSSPVANDEFLFLCTGSGDAACYNAQTGDTLWTHYFMDQFYASPIIADDKVYLLDRSGVMHIIKAAGSFEIAGESPLGENADCTPAFSDGCIYLRGRENLYCISEN